MGHIVDKVYLESVFTRFDGQPYIYQFKCEDFEGLKRHKITIPSSLGHKLQGNFYYYEDKVKPGKLVIFEHGMWTGHRGYLREIEMLASHGFLVYAHDKTGCMESEGSATFGFGQALRDLDDALCHLKKIPELNGWDIYVAGHSWGGYSAMNICAFHPDIKKVVSFAGLLSIKAIIRQHLKNLLIPFRGRVYFLEKAINPKYFECSADKSLANSNVRALIIQSKDDRTVKYRHHCKKLQRALKDNERIKFIITNGVDHNPSYSYEGIRAKKAFFKDTRKLERAGYFKDPATHQPHIEKYDWWKITEQDKEIWAQVFAFLDKD
ncbi:MAG: alpha/beta fold hydrolase [Clostridia bacterium]|nr:alpha/beta fold hydrolase [Clostridia bacterium]